MTTEHLQIGQHSIELVRSARRKRVSLEITPKGIKLRSPMRASLKMLTQFAASKEQWLDRHCNSLPPAPPSLEPHDGLLISLFEQDFELHYDLNHAGKAYVDQAQSRIVIPLKRNKDPQAAAKLKLFNCLKGYARTVIEQRVRLIEEPMEVRANKVITKDYKRRWGSCDKCSNLSFNWRLAFAPNFVSDYVAVHELAHIRVFNHSMRFWNIVSTHFPEHKLAKQWLNANGASLYRLSLK